MMTMTRLTGLTLGDLAESWCPFDRLPTAPTERAVDSHPRMETGGPEFLSLSPSPEGVLKLFHKAFVQKKKQKSKAGQGEPTQPLDPSTQLLPGQELAAETNLTLRHETIDEKSTGC